MHTKIQNVSLWKLIFFFAFWLLFFLPLSTHAAVPGQEGSPALESAAKEHCETELEDEDCNILFVGTASATFTPQQEAACSNGTFVEEAFSRTVGGSNTYYNYCYSLDANTPPVTPPPNLENPKEGIDALCAQSSSCAGVISYAVAEDDETEQKEQCDLKGGAFASHAYTTGGGSTGLPLVTYSYCYNKKTVSPPPNPAWTGEYAPLTGIPGITDIDKKDRDLPKLLNQLFILIIVFGALAAVIKIAIAGVKWMMTEVVTGKEEAKKDIWGALIGLAILLSVYVVLNTINPNLTNLDVLQGTSNISITPPKMNQFDCPIGKEDLCRQVCTDNGGQIIEPDTVNQTKLICEYSSLQGPETVERMKCEIENKQLVISGGYYCVDVESFKVPDDEIKGSNIDFDALCKQYDQTCDRVIFVGYASSNVSDQELYCSSKGGKLQKEADQGKLYNLCYGTPTTKVGGGGQVCTDPYADLREPKNFGNCNGPSGGGDTQRKAWESKCYAAGGIIEVNIPWDRCWYNHTCSNLPPKEQVQTCSTGGGDASGDKYANLRGAKSENTPAFEASCEQAGGLVNWSLDSPVTECVGLPHFSGVAPTSFVQNKFTGKTHLNRDEKARYEALERFYRQECSAHGGSVDRRSGGGQYYYLNCSLF